MARYPPALMPVAIIAILIIIFAFVLPSTSQSVVSVSQPVKFENGNYYFLVNIIPTGTEGATFVANIKPAEQSVGNIVVKPQDNVAIQFSNVKSACNYDLIATLGDIQAWFTGDKVYRIKAVPPKITATYDISVNGQKVSSSSDNSWTTKQLTPYLNFENQGLTGQSQYCSDLGTAGGRLVRKGKDGIVALYSDGGLVGFAPQLAEENSIFDAQIIDETNNKLVAYPKDSKSFGVPSILLRADARAFSSLIVNPQKGVTPTILGFSCQPGGVGGYGYCKLDLRNDGDIKGDVIIRPISPKVNMQPPQASLSLVPKVNYAVSFNIQTNVQGHYDGIDIEVCSTGANSICKTGKSNAFDVSGGSTVVPNPTPSVSQQTCQLSANAFWDGSRCGCQQGFIDNGVDKNNLKICKAEVNWFLYIGIAVIIALLIVFISRLGGRRK